MLAGQLPRIRRIALLFALAVFVVVSVLTSLLERPQFVSRQGPWAREALGQPLPLRFSSSIGRWALNNSNPSLASGHGKSSHGVEVTYVKVLAAGPRVEEFTGHTPPECSPTEEEQGCLIWASRSEQESKQNAKDKDAEARNVTSLPSLLGNVVVQFDASPDAGKEEAQLSALRLTLQTGTDIGGDAYEVDTVSLWNDTETVTKVIGTSRWISFGARRRYGVQALQELFPVESGKLDKADTDTSEQHKAKLAAAFQPAVSYFRSTLNSTDAVRLFANLYQQNVKAKEKQQTDSAKTAPVTYSSVLSSRCFWLCEVVYQDIGNPTGVVEGRAWSSCGDRLTWVSNTEDFDTLVSKANLVAFLVLFTTALPMVAGTLYQMSWMRNSRTRTLRVNPYQLMFTAFMLSLSTYMLSSTASYAPSAFSSIIGSSKPTFILYGVVYTAELLLFFLYFSVDREFTNYFRASENARQEASRRILAFFFLIWAGPSIVIAVGGLHNPWMTGVLAALFWLPQYIHCFTMDGWTGLTAPFVAANLSLVMTLLLTPLLAPEPWTLPHSHVVAVLVGTAVLVAEGCLLLALRLNDGKNLIPKWMAPWRHVYKTTAEAQQAALLENPLCPICRNPLAEGWDAQDELWRTPCNHLYHKSCLERWMQERTECPLCRKLLPEP